MEIPSAETPIGGRHGVLTSKLLSVLEVVCGNDKAISAGVISMEDKLRNSGINTEWPLHGGIRMFQINHLARVKR